MDKIRISLAQINPTVGAVKANCERIISKIEQARVRKCDIVVFPELALSGYPPEDLLFKRHFLSQIHAYLKKIENSCYSITAVLGLPYLEEEKLYNSAAIISDAKLKGVYKKRSLPNYSVFDEKRYFTKGQDLTFIKADGFSLGVDICEDIWTFDDSKLYKRLDPALLMLINLSASPYHIGKLSKRKKLLSQRAKQAKAYVIYCNLVGGQDELVFDGASMVFDPSGEMIAKAKEFSEDDLVIDINLKKRRVKQPAGLKNNKQNIAVDFKGLKKPDLIVSRKERTLSSLEGINKALVLGLKDYILKNGFNGVILGISGGIDSALTACLCVEAVGAKNVYGLSMPSMYTSAETKSDARSLCANLGVNLHEVAIDPIYKDFLALLRGYFKGMPEDKTEENLQARIRANILMAFSNKFGYLVVTTGNKSELSVGYCTLYGDTAGGFALIKDLPKTLVYKLAEFLNKKAGKDIIPGSIISRPPSAELKFNQKDSDSLPAYPLLDKIIHEYVEENKSAGQIVSRSLPQQLVSKVVNMIDKSEYKRRQYAVGVKLSPMAYGRDRRMPITNKF